MFQFLPKVYQQKVSPLSTKILQAQFNEDNKKTAIIFEVNIF